MKILFTGGGTGGHFFPLLAVIREVKRQAEEAHVPKLELYFMGSRPLKEELLREEGVISIRIAAGKMRRYASLLNLLDGFRLIWGILQAIWNMFFLMPDIVFSKGGYDAFPTVIAARLFNIPLIIHESDSVPGLVNRLSKRHAARIGVAFPSAAAYFPKEKTAFIGVPIRKFVIGGNKEEAKESFGIFSPLPVIGITGASQGAQKINDTILDALKTLAARYEIIHQTGEKNYDEVKEEGNVILEFSHKEHYHPFGFLNERQMHDFYLASDVIVSRASATTMFEIAAWSKPSIMIPLHNAAQGHQEKNAYAYAAGGACVVIQEENLTSHLLAAEIDKILANPEKMKQMGEAAGRFARADAAEITAKEILKLGAH